MSLGPQGGAWAQGRFATVHAVEHLDAWTALVRAPGSPPLDEAAIRFAACFLPEVDVAGELGRLDALAADVPGNDVDSLVHRLFVTEGLRGDTEDFNNPLNSYLPSVLDRRRGLPISLAVITIEVGRRIGVGLVGVGLPGHFLLREEADDASFIDAFAGGVHLDRAACVDLFSRFDPASTFHDRYLDATPSGEILGRMLANLLGSFARRRRRADFALALRLRGVLRDVPPPDRMETAGRLAQTGRVDWAADVLEALAEDEPGEAELLRRQATELRARLN